MYALLVEPFVEFAFMRSALAGALMLSAGACPVGVFLMLRRMSLTGDAMAHAILPGAAAGFLLFGLELRLRWGWCGSLQTRRRTVVLLVADLFHPLHCCAVAVLGNGNVSHGRLR